MKDFQVGFSQKIITPKLGTLLYGYPRDRAAKRVLDDLYVGALALQQEGKCVLLVGVDVCSLPTEICDYIRSLISDIVGIRREDVIIFATHTHSGPITTTTPGWGYANDNFLTEILYPQTIAAAKESYACLTPAVMAVASTESHIAINRRQIKDGKVILGQNPDGPYDPTMTVARFQASTGEPIATIVHYTAHATTAGSNYSITRDWPGLMVDRIKEISGAGCLYMNGAEGDIGPRISNGRTTGNESSIVEIGSIAAADAQRAYESATDFFVPKLKTLTGNILIPFAPPPTLTEVNTLIDTFGDPKKLVDVDITRYAQLQTIKKMLDRGEEFPKGLYLQQTILALGDLAIVPGPFETFCNIALDIIDGSPYARTIYLGLANGCLGYLPTEDQLKFGGYEVESFYTNGITGFVDNTGELFAEENIRLLRQLKESQ